MAAVSHPDLEDGETDPVLVKYKPEKLVSFPGFNDPMPHRTREVCKLFFFFAMLHRFSNSVYIKVIYMNMMA